MMTKKPKIAPHAGKQFEEAIKMSKRKNTIATDITLEFYPDPFYEFSGQVKNNVGLGKIKLTKAINKAYTHYYTTKKELTAGIVRVSVGVKEITECTNGPEKKTLYDVLLALSSHSNEGILVNYEVKGYRSEKSKNI